MECVVQDSLERKDEGKNVESGDGDEAEPQLPCSDDQRDRVV